MRSCLFFLVAIAGVCPGAEKTSPELDAFFARQWERVMRTQPTWAAILGRRDAPPRWPDTSPQARDQEAGATRAALAELDRLFKTLPKPTAEDRLNAELFRHQAGDALALHEAGLHLLALSPRAGIHLADELAGSLPMKTPADYEHWLALLRDFSRHLDETIELLRESMRRGLVQPREVMERVLDPLRQQLAARPQDSPFYAPFRKIPFNLPEAERQRLAAAGRDTVRHHVLPAWQRFDRFFREEYLPACLPRAGAWQWPDGAAKYAILARHHTSTDLTPEAIHQIGLAEVASLHEELEAVKKEMGFRDTLAAFFDRLRTHPSYFYDNAPQLLDGYEKLILSIEPRLPRLFNHLPRSGVVMESIPAKAAPHTSAGYYRRPSVETGKPGAFAVNLHAPHKRPKWEMLPLTLHEALPGHHLQIALAQEMTGLPEFRRHLHISAYVEGWALYAESLAGELGLETGPEQRLGRLVYDLWRSLRLVIDTGIHHHQWTRQRAIDYFYANCPKPRIEVLSEVDRYIAWPGQALAYKIGQLKIRELRARAEKELGSRFDPRAFHDTVLLGGALPLDLLEQRIADWLDSAR